MADALWSLVRRAQNPVSRQIRRCGLKGYVGAGAAGPSLAGAGRVLRHKELRLLGLVAKEPNSTWTHSQGHLPLLSP